MNKLLIDDDEPPADVVPSGHGVPSRDNRNDQGAHAATKRNSRRSFNRRNGGKLLSLNIPQPWNVYAVRNGSNTVAT